MFIRVALPSLFWGLMVLFLSCKNQSENNNSDSINGTGMLKASEPVPVVTQPITRKNFEFLIQTTGKIKSARDLMITSESDGRIQLYNVYTGTSVKAGNLLAQVDAAQAQIQLDRALLANFNAEKEYESELLSYENLLKEKNEETSSSNRKKLRISSGLANTEQDIKEANLLLKRSILKAPFAGIISDIQIQNGQIVKQGQELFRLYDPLELLMEIKVLESDFRFLKSGIPVIITPVTDPNVKFNAIVHEINPFVDKDGMIKVLLRLSPQGAKKQKLLPGMNCSATIKVADSKAIIVPKNAVVIRNGRPVVFTLERGRAKWNDVETGRDNGEEIVILNGLKTEQKVIISGNLLLAHDAEVMESDINKR